MIFINTFESTAQHIGAIKRTVKSLGYNGSQPIVTDILYDDGRVRNQKRLFAFGTPPPGEDDRSLYLDMVNSRLYRLSPGLGYIREFTFIDGYFSDAPLQTVGDAETFIAEQVAQGLYEQVSPEIIDQVTQEVAAQITQNSGTGSILVQAIPDLTLIDNVPLADKTLAFVEDANAFYHYDKTNVETIDDVLVVRSKNGAGRWIRVNQPVDGGIY